MRPNRLSLIPLGLSLLASASLVAPVSATTKGLNQIVTPDVQPLGLLSLSAQQQDPNIADRYEVQLELGLTRRLEVAIYQGYAPPVQIANAEYSLVQKGPYLLSTGFFNWSTQGSAPQPYLVSGYYLGNVEVVLGVARVLTQTPDVSGNIQNQHQYQGIVGLGYRVSPRTLLQFDYQSGSGNSTTAGFSYNVTPQLQLNPALYVSNAALHPVWGYLSLTLNVDAFSPRQQRAAPVTPPESDKQQKNAPEK